MTDHVWLEKINHNIQTLLAESEELRGREIEVRSRPDLSLEIAVDDAVYQAVDDIADEAARDLVKAAIDKWQNEAEAATPARAALPTQRSTPSRSRVRMIDWLVVILLVFVVPPLFVKPLDAAVRLSLACVGAMSGGLAGVFAGRVIVQQLTGGRDPRAWMLGELLGGILGIPIGFLITVQVLSIIP